MLVIMPIGVVIICTAVRQQCFIFSSIFSIPTTYLTTGSYVKTKKNITNTSPSTPTFKVTQPVFNEIFTTSRVGSFNIAPVNENDSRRAELKSSLRDIFTTIINDECTSS